MEIGQRVVMIKDIGVRNIGDKGVITELYYAAPNTPRAWCVCFEADGQTRYVYDDEIAIEADTQINIGEWYRSVLGHG